MASLPTTGQQNWGTPLNSYITTVVLAEASSAMAAITTHQGATDPHGDRAYAQSLVAPLTTGVNGPNGFLQLSNIGKIPNGVLPAGGGRTSSFDVVKDYSAPVNGTTDAATAIQNALNDCATSGGGEVWVGDGNFALGSTLYIQANTWLHLSQGATMTRIVNGGSGIAPPYMLANFNGSVSGSGAGNIIVEGGQWVFDGPTAAGSPMAFVGGTGVLIRNTSVRTLAQSPAILLAGCTTVAVDGVQFLTSSPSSSRSAYISSPPAVRIETAASSVISGLNAAMYTGSGCSDVVVRGCTITGATNSDGTGLYTAFGGLAGTTGAVSSSYHTGIIVSGNACVALPYNGTYPVNWQTCTITNNQFSLNNGQDASPSWSPSAPGSTNQVIANNLTTNSGTDVSAYRTTNSAGRTGTSMSNDSSLQVTVQPNAVYEVRVSVNFSSSNAELKYDFALPSGTFNYTSSRPASNAQVYMQYGGYQYITWSEVVSGTAGTPDQADASGSGVQVVGLLQVGSTGGTFALKWAQQFNAPGYPITVNQGSVMYLKRLA